RRFMLVVPLIFVPFLALMFWAFKGIKEIPTPNDQGHLMDLPEARFLNKDVKIGKMEYYERAKDDSLRKQENRNKDPYMPQSFLPSRKGAENFADSFLASPINSPSWLGMENQLNTDEQLIYDKLHELEQALQEPQLDSQITRLTPLSESVTEKDSMIRTTLETAQVDRLENLMGKMTDSTGQDEELNTLNSMLETIRDIQDPPDLTRDRLGFQPAKADSVFEISTNLPVHEITRLALPTLDNSQQDFVRNNQFHSIKKVPSSFETPNTISAVIHQSQSLRNGDVVKLRLTQAIRIGGVAIPANSFVYGLANLNKQRLEIQINRIRMGGTLIPVDLKIYDLDGLEGIHIPGALIRDVAKESAGRTVQSIGLQGIDQNWSTQAALAGMETAKDLIKKKVRLVRVSLKAGYQVLLMDGSHQRATYH
ncbi:MAG: conjugative transposon protein TraM, partial [Sphingobacterium sp.]